MVAVTADDTIKPQEPAKGLTSKKWSIALAMHLAACRFGSPAGVAFLPQNYLPLSAAKKD